MSADRTCSHCGAPLPRDALDAFCADCRSAAGVEPVSEREAAPRSTDSPSAARLSPGASKADARPESSGVRHRLAHYFGDYLLIGRIAEGGMGVVWRAKQLSLNRKVALKMIRAGALATNAEIQRFRAEAEAAARLDHPNIVPIYEVGEHEGQQYFSMKLVDGRNVAEELAGQPMENRRAAALMAKVARAVHFAHQNAVLHRDLKPGNVLLDERGEPLLTDFGLAKRLDQDSGQSQSVHLTGTPAYMAPEQAEGRATTLSDVYGLGAILYELLTGRAPFCGANAHQTLRMVLETEPKPPRRLNPDVDLDLETICLKCLGKRPANRYAHAESLAQDLERWLRGEPILARPVATWERAAKWVRRHPLRAALTGAVVLLVALGWWAQTQHRHATRQGELAVQRKTLLRLQQAENHLAEGQFSLGLTALAELIRDEPDNRVVVERLINTLNYRSFLVPTPPPATAPPPPRLDPQLAFRHVLSADGRRLATATNEGTIQIWDAGTGQALVTLPNAHTNVIRSVSFSRDGRRLVSASADQTAKIWDIDSRQRLTTLPHPSTVHHADFNPAADRVVTACRDGVMRVWEVNTGRLLVEGIHQPAPLNSARFSPSGEIIATATENGVVMLWHAATAQPAAELIHLSAETWDARFLSRDRLLRVVLDGNETRHFQRTRTDASVLLEGQPLLLFAPEFPLAFRPVITNLHRAEITFTNLSSDGRRFATASADLTARVWDARTLAAITGPLLHSNTVNCVRFSPDGRRLVTSTAGGTVRLWDSATGQPLSDEWACAQPVADVAFSADGRLVFADNGQWWAVAMAAGRAPSWLPELAEGIAGVHLEKCLRVQEELQRASSSDPLTQWAKRLLSGEDNRGNTQPAFQ